VRRRGGDVQDRRGRLTRRDGDRACARNIVAESAIDEERRSGAVAVIDVPALEGEFPIVLVRRRDPRRLSERCSSTRRVLGARLG